MSDTSARIGLPLLEAGQAQKEWFHNEALALIDIACQATVQGSAVAPPGAPEEGQCWIVAAGAGGAWAGHDGALAGWTAGGWRFVAPREGFVAWSLAGGTTVRRRGGAWVADRSPAIPAPSGGAVVDAECRAAVAALLAALSERGWLP